MDVSCEELTFEVINFLSKNLRRFSYTKDFFSLYIHGLYLYDTQGFIQIKTNEEQRKPTQMFTKDH